MEVDDLLHTLRKKARPAHLESMGRFGIGTAKALGVPIPELRRLARTVGKDHPLALALWESGIHEARILASMVDDPALVTRRQLVAWVKAFDSWDICDQVCGNLLDRTPFGLQYAAVFAGKKAEYVKRAGFVLVAEAAVHRKDIPDTFFSGFLSLIEREAKDGRNFVKKAVNWALRQIGKRSELLRQEAIICAERILSQDDPPAKWIARDALRELREA